MKVNVIIVISHGSHVHSDVTEGEGHFTLGVVFPKTRNSILIMIKISDKPRMGYTGQDT